MFDGVARGVAFAMQFVAWPLQSAPSPMSVVPLAWLAVEGVAGVGVVVVVVYAVARSTRGHVVLGRLEHRRGVWPCSRALRVSGGAHDCLFYIAPVDGKRVAPAWWAGWRTPRSAWMLRGLRFMRGVGRRHWSQRLCLRRRVRSCSYFFVRGYVRSRCVRV